jgi:3-phenylpropionate/trans-cinnamate dioxygenase ferredoxin reductase subunit
MADSAAGMVIVGAGQCGARAALTLREAGYRGPVTLIGAEPHLPYERPPLSKHTMAGDDEPAIQPVASEGMLFEAAIVHLATMAVTAIDRHQKSVTLANDARLHYDRLLLATGARPRKLPIAAASRRAVYLRTFDDAVEIRTHLKRRARLAIIGGGFIGLELAAAARRLGAQVTVIEAQPRILMRGVPAEIAAVLHAAHEAHGVKLVCGQSIEAIEDRGEGVAIRLGGGETLVADVCVIGVGAVPNVDLAERAGLAIDNGVAVDEHLTTSDRSIFAAGDCCSFPLALYGGRRVRLEAWRNAEDQGALAAKNMLGAADSHVAVPWFWTDQYDLGLQIAGLPDEGAETVRRDLGDGGFILFHLAADGRLVAASGIAKETGVGRDIRLAEMLIGRRAYPPRDQLASPAVKLKALLAA